MLRSEPFSGAADPGLNFIDDENNAVLAADVVKDAEVVLRGHDKSAFAKHRLGNHRRDRLGRDNPFEGIFQMMRESFGGGSLLSAVGIGEWNPVNVAREGANPALYGCVLLVSDIVNSVRP